MTLIIDTNDANTCEQLSTIRESYEFEAKEAQGKDGKGAVPKSIWSSYSAMANSDGGYILLGAKEEEDGSLTFTGIQDTAKVIDDFWNTINNPSAVNKNILQQDSVEIVRCKGVNLILIKVERAPRREKPIHISDQPYNNTYKRLNQGDYRCDRDEVNRMIAEASIDARDGKLLDDFTLENDIDLDSLTAFRNDFASSKPRHPYLILSDKELLRKLGGWRTERSTGIEGLTMAGLLMFGNWASIREALPHYAIDYQDHTRLLEGQRWSDRVTPDGYWSGNLYDFYLKVYPKLVSDFEVPFQITTGGKRIDETDMHVAIREALINTLVHADYSLTTGILAVKKSTGFSFRNPGLSRIPIEQIYQGGISDCRNPSLQLMFQMVGGAEKAGSGFPKITHAWAEKHWRRPVFIEKSSPETVELELLTISLYPEWVTQKLEMLFGDTLKDLSSDEMAILATAAYEETIHKKRVTNKRLQDLLDLHPTDITKLLGSLVERGMLNRQRTSRWSEYEISPNYSGTEKLPPEHQDFLFPHLLPKDGEATASSTDKATHIVPTPSVSIPNTRKLPPNSKFATSNLQDSTPRSLEQVPQTLEQTQGDLEQAPKTLEQIREQLEQVLLTPSLSRTERRAAREAAVLAFASDFISVNQLAELLSITPEAVRVTYINKMLEDGRLEPKYSEQLVRRGQAYRARRVLGQE